ncbi:unnamed protein product [Allacma fusca]|uniref:Uncharacterized protein n=1 Tax=Allacma fusca TaxID=39272 RepID=A0A8J2KVN5_9HEXA|nr:unnamed protein product [Allacma fusca]
MGFRSQVGLGMGVPPTSNTIPGTGVRWVKEKRIVVIIGFPSCHIFGDQTEDSHGYEHWIQPGRLERLPGNSGQL